MLKNYMLIVFFIFFSLNIVFAQVPSIEWQKCYGAGGNEYSNYIQQTSDGGYITCCYNANSGIGYHQFWIVKLNSSGGIAWEKFMGGSGDDEPFSIQQTTDGGYIVVGTTNSNDGDITNNHGNYDYWVIKLNSTGDITWQKTFGGSAEDRAWFIQETPDGGYIVAGESESSDGDITNGHGMDDYWILKLNSAGGLLWQKSFGGSDEEQPYCIRLTPDGGYIVAGISNSWDGDVTNPGHVPYRAWIIKLNIAGNIEWENTYGSVLGGESALSICLANDGGYCFIGQCSHSGGDVTGNHGNFDYWIVKLNASGSIGWQISLGGTGVDIPTSIVSTADGGFVAGGWTTSFDGDITGNHGGYSDYWLTKVSSTGVLDWQKAIGGTGSEQSLGGCQTADGGYVLTGTTGSSNSGDVGPNNGAPGTDDIWIVKLVPNLTPVTLTGFDANIKSKYVLCEWQTQQEQNSSHFIVERSMDAVHFIPLGRISAKGNSAILTDYNFTDRNALQTKKQYLYYRLKMVDLDGSFKYSNDAKVALEYPMTISIAPMPAVDYLNVSFASIISEDANATIYDETGKKVYQETISVVAGINAKKINIVSLLPGFYSLTLRGKNNNYTSGFIKANK